MKYAVVVAVVLLSGCASAIVKKLPSDFGGFVVAGYFTSYDGDAVRTDRLIAEVENEIIRRGYTVVDRSSLPLALREMGTNMSGAFDAQTIVELGKMKGAKYLIFVSANWDRTVMRCTEIKTMTVIFSETKVLKPQTMTKELISFLENRYGR